MTLSCQLPPPLRPGDRLHVVVPSGTLREPDALHRGIEIWRSRGYEIELGAGFDARWGYLAGKDCDRRQQLATALKDPECHGVLCGRGGYGGARLLEDWVWPRDSAQTVSKWLIGYSDITSLLWSLAQVGVAGVHGPVLTNLAAEPEWSLNRLFDCVEGCPLPALQGIGWGGGKASGVLLPANLTVATHLLGTPVQPNLTDVILALEDVSEVPYRIDRMLTQWRMSGAFKDVRGIALGRFSQCYPPAHIPSFTVEEVLRDRLGDLGIPVVSDLPFGHDGPNAALPVGLPVCLDADQGLLNFE